MCYVPESDIRLKSYDHSNLLRASVVQFRASRYIMSPNRTSEWKVMTIRISRELPLFNLEHLDILFSQIGHPCEKLWPFEFPESFRYSISSVLIYYVPELDICAKCYDHSNFSRASVVLFRASRWVTAPNRTFVWKDMTIQSRRDLPLFNFERLDILCPLIGHTSETIWLVDFLESFHCSISSVSIYYFPVSDIRLKCYDYSNFSRASVVQFQASGWVMSPNRTSCEKLGPFKFLESFRCSILSISTYYVPNSDIRVKSYDHLNSSSTSVVQFRASR